MAHYRTLLWAGLGAMALPSPAGAQPDPSSPDVCGAIERIAAAARERPAFGSIRRALAAGEVVVPGFAAGQCESTRHGIECEGDRGLYPFHNWPDLAACRGLVSFDPPPRPRQLRWPSNRSFRRGPFVIARGVWCPGCRALGPAFFRMTLDGRAGRRR